jgi:class 3 adenylate cyclase
LTVFYFVNTSAIFNRETQIVNYTQLKTATEKDLLKTEDLLKQMMPAHVVENMKNHKTLTEKVHNVTLLYSDIVGFTEWSSKKSPKEIVNVLSEIFSRFDRLCLRHNVYKVHTIGDCYVVLGNLDFSQRNPGLECLNVVQMALAMIEVMKEVNLELAVNLNIRIGIHSGSMIAGIVGTDVVRYDIYGPDVLVANQMESNGSPGRINVSDATRELLLNMEARFNFVFNKELNFVTINKKIRTFLLSKE